MTLSRSSAADSTNNSNRSSAGTNHKRNFEDYVSSSPDYVGGPFFLQKMRKHEGYADRMEALAQQNLISWGSGNNCELDRFISSSSECSSTNRPESTRLQIFVRMISDCKTIVIQADKDDTVEKLHQRIEWKTKIPASFQRVIYRGKQLQYERKLAYYSIEQDALLQLVARMQSTSNPVAWRTIDDIMYTISRMYKGENLQCNIDEKISFFFEKIPDDDNEDETAKYFMVFSSSSVLPALVMLYGSPLERNKTCAKNAIQLFLNNCLALSKTPLNYCVPIVLEFCKLLRKVCPDQKLYVTSRNTLGSMMEKFDKPGVFYNGLLTVGVEIFPFFTELSSLLVKELVQNSGPISVFQKFSSFWLHLEKAILCQVPSLIPVVLPLRNTAMKAEIEQLHDQVFRSLLTTMDVCMCKVESLLADKEGGNSEIMPSCWSQYLGILKIINSMSNLYQGGKEQLAGMLNKYKISFCTFIVKFANRGEDHQWIVEYKEATNFEARKHLAMLLFPDVKEDFDEMYEMLIDRSNLLAESFAYIVGASPEALHGGLFMEFKNEEATGPGVLREWFYLVCQEIFSPKNTLFLRSADDFRRFSPNPASKVDPLHPDFFEFTGRVIALSLMHKVQVGVLFDRVFFLQLAGQKISLEDIKDTDRIMYNSCKQILEMDPEFFDSSAGLGLTFVLETEELGKRDTIELCEGGKFMAVNSKNRKRYVDLLIERRFATPIIEQVQQFSRGFTNMLSKSVPKSFFKTICLEDLDGMLRGGENPISIDDWKAHTGYNGFKETDPEIEWFWKVLRKMTEEEQRSLLFFWTSSKYVPVEGFRGLSSKLYIYRTYEANDHLPVSHTCFYRLCIPKYPTKKLMEQRLRFIAQDHVSSSFGKW